MHSFTKLSVLAGLAAIACAATVHQSHCSNPKLVSSTTIEAGNVHIEYTSHSCAPQAVESRDNETPDSPRNVCDEICTTSCSDATGRLPPISQDCQTIEDAIQIFSLTTTFIVDPYHLKTLTFGTCSYSFLNQDYEQLEYCWSNLSAQASAAGSACFPPVQPFFSEGICSASDGTWSVSAAHS